ncbi:hypothetical protein ACFLUJ_03180 [Chloroflexota bacterium]
MPAPAVQAFLYIERINHGEWVEFLVDTGASGTCLHGIYAFDLQAQMRHRTIRYSECIGGMKCGYFHEEATLLFRDDAQQPVRRFTRLAIQQFTEECMNEQDTLKRALGCPPLLGRDILSRWEFSYNHQKQDVRLISL